VDMFIERKPWLVVAVQSNIHW